MKHPHFKAAAVQAAPVFLDLEKTVDKVIRLIEEAAANGADIINFPETFVPGYPFWIWLDAPIWGMQFAQRYFNNSLVFGSDQHKRIMKAAAKNNIMVTLGCSERKGGSLYISQTMIDKNGEVIVNRRKLKPTHVERSVFGEGDGSDLKVHDTEIGRLGGLCCWEHVQPLSKYALYAQNEQIHVGAWPGYSVYSTKVHALGFDVNNAINMVYAVEGQCFVIASCSVVDQHTWDVLGVNDVQKEYLPLGGGYSRIFSPDGQVLNEILPPDQEGIVYADIDLNDISRMKTVADPAGHYARPDATRLILNSTPKQALEFEHADARNSQSRYASSISDKDLEEEETNQKNA